LDGIAKAKSIEPNEINIIRNSLIKIFRDFFELHLILPSPYSYK